MVDEHCDWPECTEPALCSSGNFGGKLVCRYHFRITNGLTPEQYTAEIDGLKTENRNLLDRQEAHRTKLNELIRGCQDGWRASREENERLTASEARVRAALELIQKEYVKLTAELDDARDERERLRVKLAQATHSLFTLRSEMFTLRSESWKTEG